MAPALGFVNVYPFRYSFVADHFQYLASIGLITLAAAGAVRLIPRLRFTSSWPGEALLVAAIGIPLAVVTASEARHYVSTETLFSATLRRNPLCWLCHDNLGILRPERSVRRVAGRRSPFSSRADDQSWRAAGAQ